MINITDKHNCCGCSACASICPKHCITMQADNEGFLYPKVNETDCIDCGLCEKVCHELHPFEERKPQKVYAAINKDEEVRLKSSSGGIFYLLAEKTIAEGGVVFGARFDEQWQVVIDYAETMEGVKAFMGSKYVQARMETAYTDAKRFLTEGRKVLFSGTPCQIAGLHHFLRKPYDNLLTVDIVCHGVPSPLVWKEYLKELIERPKGVAGNNSVLSSLKEKPVITGISFRDKSEGWKQFGFVIRGMSASKAGNNSVLSSVNNENKEFVFREPMEKNLFMRLFLKNIILRPSCYECHSKSGRSYSDVSLADYWGIWRISSKMYDNKGTSLVLGNSSKGVKFLLGLNFRSVETSYADALRYNPAIEKSCKKTEDEFWDYFKVNGLKGMVEYLKKYEISFPENIVVRIKSLIKRILEIFYYS